MLSNAVSPFEVTNQENLKSYGITEFDLRVFSEIGKPFQDVLNELNMLSKPQHFPSVVSPATLQNGFVKLLDEQELETHLRYFSDVGTESDLSFLVPAAGAASRQMQLLKTVLNIFDSPVYQGAPSPENILSEEKNKQII